jgi:hypothetical protein
MEEQVLPQQPQQGPHVPPNDPAVVSAGESDNPHHDARDGQDEDDDDEDDETLKYSTDDPLYGANLDDEDEAWVYQNLRSGIAEPVAVVRRTHNGQRGKDDRLEQAKLLRPRDSDAVLSCPCCFTIVCMDCQRHETYPNQYRAMFVMNISLQSKLIYDNHSKQLVEATMDLDENDTTTEIYHSVNCLECKTQVAALDMKEEVYHFFGCLASS